MSNSIKYAIVIPVLNAAPTLPDLLKRTQQALANQWQNTEIILVDDGSYDDSWNVMLQLASEYERVSIIKLTRNFGQFAATTCGILQTKGEYVITLDDDLQYQPEDILPLLNYLQQGDFYVVYGLPVQKKYNLPHKLGAKVVAYVIFDLLLKHKGRQKFFSSFKAFNAGKCRPLMRQAANGTYPMDIDTYINWSVPIKKIGFMDVAHQPRQHGQSGYTFLYKARIFFNYMLRYMRSPLLPFTLTGLGLLSVVVIHLILQACCGVQLLNFIPTSAWLVGLGALLFIACGLLGTYAAYIYLLLLGKPPYVIEEIHQYESSNPISGS